MLSGGIRCGTTILTWPICATLGAQNLYFFSIVHGFRLDCVMVDVLHCVDLGVASHILCIVRGVLGGANYGERLNNLNANLRAWYKRVRWPYRVTGKLRLERIRPEGDWVKMIAKGAQTRHLACYALYIMQTFGEINSLDDFTKLHDQLALGCCQMLVRFYELLNLYSYHLDAAARDELTTVENNLVFYMQGCRSWRLVVACATGNLATSFTSGFT